MKSGSTQRTPSAGSLNDSKQQLFLLKQDTETLVEFEPKDNIKMQIMTALWKQGTTYSTETEELSWRNYVLAFFLQNLVMLTWWPQRSQIHCFYLPLSPSVPSLTGAMRVLIRLGAYLSERKVPECSYPVPQQI